MAILSAIVRLIALLWVLLITALIGNVIATNIYSATSSIAAINFTIFVAALSWIVGLYRLAAAFVSALALPVVLISLDVLGVLFTFIDAIVLAAKIKGVNCSNYGIQDPAWIAFGSDNTTKRCREIQASTAFMWFLWASFSVCLFLSIKDISSGGGGGFSFGRSSRREFEA